MTSVAPPPPPVPAQQGGAVAQLVVTLPPQSSAALQLSQLSLDNLISGLLKPTGAQNEVLFQSDLGDLKFKLPFSLPNETQASFRLIQKTPAVQIQLVAINDKAVTQNMSQNRLNGLIQQQGTTGSTNLSNTPQGAGQNTASSALNLQGSTPATLLNLNNANGIRAFVLTSTNTAGATQTGTTPTSSHQGAALNPQSQQSLAQNANATTSRTTSPPFSTNQNTAQQGSSPRQNISIQAGNQLNVRLLSVELPNQGASNTQSPAATTSGNTVITQGTVQGMTAQSQPIIKTPQGLIALDTQAKMPEGTKVQLEILSSSKPTTVSTHSTSHAVGSDILSVGKNWPALEEAINLVREQNPALADMMQNNLLPKPDSRLALNLIFFLKAIGRGNFKNWADEKTIKTLAKSKPELLKTLEGDFSQISEKAKTPNSTDWKIAYIPLQDNGNIHQIRIAQRDHKEEKQDGKEPPGVRFVIDLELSRLGAMQLDGLAKESSKKFHLILRTHRALPGFMRKEIHSIYESGMQSIGFEGKLAFQVTPNFVEIEGVDLSKTKLNLGMLV